MKKAALLAVFLVLLAGGTYFGLRAHEKQTIIQRCEVRQTESNLLLEALAQGDKTICTRLSSPLRERCQAIILNNSDLCQEDDLDCHAIASHNETLCAEPLCRAMASGNESHCDLLADSADWCKRMVRHEPTPVDNTVCQELAELPN